MLFYLAIKSTDYYIIKLKLVSTKVDYLHH